jgi:hypothetical protein
MGEVGLAWAREGDSYRAMQGRLAQAYFELRAKLRGYVAPVGLPWQLALTERPGLELWKDDGRRPSRTRSYLTACVFYMVFTHRDPAGSSFTGGLDRAEARWLQQIAVSVHRIYPKL